MSGNRVYSTESGRICPKCDKALALCRCKPLKQKSDSSPNALKQSIPNDGVIRLMRDSKGRKGAGATLVHGLQGDEASLKKTAKALKQLCGCGGAVKNGVIEIQGDQREKIKAWFEAKNLTVKLAGG